MRCQTCRTLNPPATRRCHGCGTPLTETSPGHDALDRLGDVLHGRYRLRNLIGIGGNGAVYQAEVVGVGHAVAVKVLHPVLSVDSTARRRLEREARLASQIDHPNVVGIVDFQSHPELTYLVMEYLTGVSLAEVLQEVGYLSARRTIHIIRQVLSALEASHAVDVLHRDIKPENIYLTARQDDLDFVKVLDFGMAVPTSGHDERITAAGRICGTPAYMSPEQVRNRQLEARSDLYTVGVILYECLTGQNPFLAKGASGTMVNQVTLKPRPPSEQCPEAGIPPYFDAVVMRALRKEPSERFGSAAEFRWVLEGLALAQTKPSAQSWGALRTCGECGQVNLVVATQCEGCGQSLREETLQRQPMTPDMIDALDASAARDLEDYELAPTTTVTAHRPVGWTPPLIGRSREKGQLEQWLKPAGSPLAQSFVRIVGRPGTGKARLARELTLQLAKPAWRSLWVAPEQLPIFSVLYPVRKVVAQLLGIVPRQRDADILVKAAADKGLDVEHHGVGLCEIFGLVSADGADVVSRRARRAQALRALLQLEASRNPTLIVFQDLHLYDAPSQELVAALVSFEPLPHPLAIIVTHDPDLLVLWGESAVLDLGALGATEAKELASVLYRQLRVEGDPRLAVEACGGNPLMLIELSRLAAMGIVLDRPRGLADVVDRRISQLPPRARTLLHGMAVLGCSLDVAELGELIGSSDPLEDDQTLRYLSSLGFVANEGTSWRLSHRVHRDVAYSTIPVALRQSLHVRAAEHGILRDEPPAFIAHHLYESGQKERALAYLILAGESALAALDDRLAAEMFNRSYRLIAAPQVGAERGVRSSWLAVTRGMARALFDGGEPRAAVRWLRQAEAQARAALWPQEAQALAEAPNELAVR